MGIAPTVARFAAPSWHTRSHSRTAESAMAPPVSYAWPRVQEEALGSEQESSYDREVLRLMVPSGESSSGWMHLCSHSVQCKTVWVRKTQA